MVHEYDERAAYRRYDIYSDYNKLAFNVGFGGLLGQLASTSDIQMRIKYLRFLNDPKSRFYRHFVEDIIKDALSIAATPMFTGCTAIGHA